ncbi:two-component system, OmpR family, alkaline phosphatase synthesis response regulator PhoP [Thermodesulfovibrio aggregans]|uniref:Phosphate regulon transcriptional regulatory protein PhoB n=1 Tax=Thermodesulfovibrio aggregans TaxID=86166 RepID=A0A0U9I9K4_9BACT|nr:response regulator [Thermodesulfovibrio aggregans]GAQ94646.1 two-component system, OmpR family, alkaline phosphatase synthesis response regulator PhoP [Thermodesulfovibrio aggregans]
MNEKILIVEDEKEIADLIAYTLKKEKFDVSVALDGETALKKLRENFFDLVILDLMLPKIQGLEICKIIRNNPEMQKTGIIIVTAKGEELDKITGLEAGADDYITKPFSPKELLARTKAVLRRTIRAHSEQKIIKIKEMVIDKEKYLVTVKGQPKRLSATEFKLLLYLAERPNKIFNRDHLLDAVWGQDIYVDARTVDVHIRRLRLKIEDDPDNPEYIKTLRGVGYYIED